jgi:hypothetical protein
MRNRSVQFLYNYLKRLYNSHILNVHRNFKFIHKKKGFSFQTSVFLGQNFVA